MNKVCKEFINSTRKFIFPLIRIKHYKFLIPIHKDFSKKTSTRKKDDYDMFYGIKKLIKEYLCQNQSLKMKRNY